MINQIKLLWISLTGEHTLKAIWKLIYGAIGWVSSLFSFAVLLKDLVGLDKVEMWSKGHWWLLLIGGLFISCICNRKKLSFCKKVSNRDMQIALSVKDIFSNKAATSFVISTNTFFRTKMDNEYISPRSVQGRFQLKYFEKNTKDLNAMISASLKKQKIVGEDCTDCFGSTKKYPIGTVAKVEYKKKKFYFVAINDVNKYGKSIEQTNENITIALSSIVDAIQRMGHCDTLCIPLIGSGSAAIPNTTKETVCQKIVDCFIQSQDKVTSKLIISINPEDYLNGEVDLNRIEQYIDYKCEFG